MSDFRRVTDDLSVAPQIGVADVEAAETARRTGIIAAFLTAASLLVSAIGAYWAAQKGGNHRDKGTVMADVFRRF